VGSARGLGGGSGCVGSRTEQGCRDVLHLQGLLKGSRERYVYLFVAYTVESCQQLSPCAPLHSKASGGTR
jgi:hypothetical protein